MEYRPLLHLGVVAIEKRAFGSPSTKVANFTYIAKGRTPHTVILPSVTYPSSNKQHILKLVIFALFFLRGLVSDSCTSIKASREILNSIGVTLYRWTRMICRQTFSLKFCCVSQTIQLNISHLFTHNPYWLYKLMREFVIFFLMIQVLNFP